MKFMVGEKKKLQSKEWTNPFDKNWWILWIYALEGNC